MSFLHESLYRDADFASIGFSEYLQRLSANLTQSYARGCEIILETQFDEVLLT